MSTTLTVPNPIYKTPNEILGARVDMSGLLRDGEMFSGSPTATVSGTLTTSSVAVSTTPLVIDGKTVDAGKAITFTLSAGTDGITYSVAVKCSTSQSQTRERYVTVIVGTS